MADVYAPTFPRYDVLSRDGLTPTMRNDVSRLYESTNIMRENASSVNSRRVGGDAQLRGGGMSCKRHSQGALGLWGGRYKEGP